MLDLASQAAGGVRATAAPSLRRRVLAKPGLQERVRGCRLQAAP